MSVLSGIAESGVTMALIERIRVAWTGFTGSPGVSTFYAIDASVQRARIQDLFGNLGLDLPQQVNISVEGSGDVIDSVSGEIRSTWTAGAPLLAQGGGAGAYSAPSGAQVQWISDAILQGRRFVGKTFLVPLMGSAYQLDGTLSPAVLANINTYALAMYQSNPGNLLVYRRPRAATPAWTDVHGKLHPAKAAADGSFYPVVSHRTPDKACVLRSRRD